MKTKALVFTVSTVMALGLVGCGGGSGSGQAAPTQLTATGTGMLGPMVGATVVATDYATGFSLPGAMAVTTSDGSYTLQLQSKPTGALVLTMSGGSYLDEATGQTTTQSQPLHAVIPTISGNTVSAAITPLTEIAYQLYIGGYHDANAQVAQLFFSGSGVTDVTQVIPANPTQTLPNTASGQYEYVLAQISAAAQSAATESSAWAVNEGGTIVAAASGAVSPVSLPSASGVTTANGFTAPSGSTVTFTASTNTYTTPALLSDPSRTLLWLNAGTGLSTNNAWSVPEWDDQSGNGIKCALYGVYGGNNTVPTGSEIPAYVASAQGGQPAISFDGGNGKDDEFVCNDVYVNGASNVFNSFSSLTVIYVASGSSSYTNGGGVIHNSVWTSTLATSLPNFDNTSPMALSSLSLSGQSEQYQTLNDTSLTGYQIVTATFNVGSSSSVSLADAWLGSSIQEMDPSTLATPAITGTAPIISSSNAADPTTTAGYTISAQSGLSIGSGFAGTIQEIVILNSASDAPAVVSYLASKYGLTITQ